VVTANEIETSNPTVSVAKVAVIQNKIDLYSFVAEHSDSDSDSGFLNRNPDRTTFFSPEIGPSLALPTTRQL